MAAPVTADRAAAFVFGVLQERGNLVGGQISQRDRRHRRQAAAAGYILM
ncbi:hypothetical protein [Mesorhizobium sp. M1409]